jgi:hypothetical protein
VRPRRIHKEQMIEGEMMSDGRDDIGVSFLKPEVAPAY